MALLEVDQLRVTLQTSRGAVEALRGVSFTLDRGQTLGLIGESGCGKSLTALALMGLLPEGAQVAGSIRFDGRELTTLGEAGLCRLRGNRIGMVFQEPMTALNPLHTVGRQIGESLRLHQGLSAAASRAQALRLLEAWADTETVEKRLPGVSMAVVHDQQLLWSRGFGYAHLEPQVAAEGSTYTARIRSTVGSARRTWRCNR